MSSNLDERINPEVAHRIRIGRECFEMPGRDLIVLLNSPMEAKLCEGTIPAKWLPNPADLSDHLWRNESCITALPSGDYGISAMEYADWLFSLGNFSRDVIGQLHDQLLSHFDDHFGLEMKARIEKALLFDLNETDAILLRHLKTALVDSWDDGVCFEAELSIQADDVARLVIDRRDCEMDDEPIICDLFKAQFLHEQRQDIKKLCRYMGLHHIAEQAAAMQLVSVPAIRQLALS